MIKCPCGSGKSIVTCCLLSKTKEHSSPKNILPPDPQTRFSHKKCYMGKTNNCYKKISKEHYISAGVLKEIDEMIEVQGFPWLGQVSKQLPISSLTAKVLCCRHNAAFSAIDDIGIAFFESIKNFSQVKYSGKKKLSVFNGLDVERWLLKILYGLLFSNNMQISQGDLLSTEINQKCIDLIYGKVSHAPNRGLFLRTEVDYKTKTKNHLSVSPVINKLKRNIQGMRVNILGFDFLLTTRPINVEDSIYRPDYIVFSTPGDIRVINLVWPVNGKKIIKYVSVVE